MGQSAEVLDRDLGRSYPFALLSNPGRCDAVVRSIPGFLESRGFAFLAFIRISVQQPITGLGAITAVISGGIVLGFHFRFTYNRYRCT